MIVTEQVYKQRRRRYIQHLASFVGVSDAEDVLHDAVEDALRREIEGLPTKWAFLLRRRAYVEWRRRQRVDVGLDVRTLGHAADLAEAYERRRAAELAQRVLTHDELSALLAEYEFRPPAETSARIRIARRKLRKAWKLEPDLATRDGYVGCA